MHNGSSKALGEHGQSNGCLLPYPKERVKGARYINMYNEKAWHGQNDHQMVCWKGCFDLLSKNPIISKTSCSKMNTSTLKQATPGPLLGTPNKPSSATGSSWGQVGGWGVASGGNRLTVPLLSQIILHLAEPNMPNRVTAKSSPLETCAQQGHCQKQIGTQVGTQNSANYGRNFQMLPQ